MNLQRIITFAAVGPPAVLLIHRGGRPFRILAAGVAGTAAGELHGLLTMHRNSPASLRVGAATAVGVFTMTRPSWKWALAGFLCDPRDGTAASIASCLVVGNTFASWVADGTADEQVRRSFLSIVIGTWAADAASDLTGTSWGGPHLPRWVNDRKVYSAYGVGVAATAVTRTALNRYAPTAPGAAVASGVLAALGDIAESAVKRRAGVKDSGNVLPGYGGVLDRVDSLLANLVVHRLLRTGRARSR
ncbi:phosphatidate cytidylyltransferase [Actinoplanes sp. NPDC051494]|uniref:phosphatidate cytidylyltransferase n=1 Tax=Actinoplanes sp. NPDC051494 TaxID=3363907 RepID=UPI003795F455